MSIATPDLQSPPPVTEHTAFRSRVPSYTAWWHTAWWQRSMYRWLAQSHTWNQSGSVRIEPGTFSRKSRALTTTLLSALAKCFGFCLFGHNDLLLVFLLFWHAPLAVRGAKHRQQSLQSGWFWAILITSIGERFFDFRSWCSIVWNHVTRGRPGGLLQSFGEEAVKILSVRFVRHSCNVPKQEEMSWMDYGQEMGGLLYWWAKSSLLVTLSTTTKRKRWMWYVQCCQLIDWLTHKLLWPLTEAYVVLESATVRLETNLGGARERCSECVCIQVYYRF